MIVALINGSPKRNNSGSEVLLDDLHCCFSGEVKCKKFHLCTTIVDDASALEMMSCDVWVFAFPLYVDGIPSQLLSCLCKLEQMVSKSRNIVVYGMVNSGFYEGKQNRIAIDILKNWCIKSGLKWGMGIGVGGGGSLSQIESVPLGRGPKTSLGKAMNQLKTCIETRESADNFYVSVNMPRWFYKFAAEIGWKRMIKKNGRKVRDLSTKEAI